MPTSVTDAAQPHDDVLAHVGGPEHLGVLHEPEHPGPECRKVGARHLHVDRSVGVACDDAGRTELTLDGAGPGPVHAHRRDRIDVRIGADSLRIARESISGVEPGRTGERGVLDDVDVAGHPIDAVRARLVVLVVTTDHVPEAVAKEQPVGVEPALLAAVLERHRAPARRSFTERRQRRKLRHGGRHRRTMLEGIDTQLPQRLHA